MIPSTLPANVPAIPIRGLATAVSLVALDGTTIPVTVGPMGIDGYALATWSVTLVPGKQYTMRWTDECAAGRERSFDATASKPLPTTAGTLSAAPRSVSMMCDDAGRPTGVAFADLRLTPSAELAPFLGVAAVDVVTEPEASFVSGQPYGGGGGLVGGLGQKCPFGPRDFRVSARVRIPNGPTLTTDAIDVSLPCPTTCVSEPVYTPDANASDTGGSDAGLGGSADPHDATVTSCSASRGGGGSAALVFTALGLAALGQVSRRRR